MRKAKALASSQKSALASSKKPAGRLEDISAQVQVRRHPGARRLTLRISRTSRSVIVTIPVQCDLDEAGTFLNRHIDWVRERLDSLPDPVPFRNGSAMPLRGEPHRIVFTGQSRTTPTTTVISKVSARPPYTPSQLLPGLTAGASLRLPNARPEK